MKKALVSTHKGVVSTAFRPYMCEFFLSAREELSFDYIMNHIGGLMGTRSHVTERRVEEKKEVSTSLSG